MSEGLLVCIESPWAGLDAGARAQDYLRMCIRDSLGRGEIPIASHVMLAWTRALWDEDPEQRAEGMELAKSYILRADLIAFYLDYGESAGMKAARHHCSSFGKKWVARYVKNGQRS